ncbi:permease [Bacillus suaedaesalsae]|uniref:Permease n=1 Tax=Bacillus suaedaesalsae TaxID=2810349 RepID=A0ABS2DFK0_9BACI|nr:permease [Bacillus suaedaesalsae]MBM6616348.1 permease [Bacillus suaedaesalsae]
MNEKLTFHKDFIGFGLIALFIFLFFFSHITTSFFQTLSESVTIITIFSIFFSIIIKAIPFVLLGAVVSAILSIYVSEKKIERVITSHPVLGWLLIMLCSGERLLPIASRYMNKGMPTYIGIVLLFVAPVLNPVVLASTYVAFSNTPEIMYVRIGLSLVLSLFLGVMVYLIFQNKNLFTMDAEENDHKPRKWLQAVSDKFFEVGKYVLIGAGFVSVMQTLIGEKLVEIGSNELLSSVLLMTLSFVLSISPVVDSFIASSFEGTLPTNSILAFLLFGAMFNLRNVAILSKLFQVRFIVNVGSILFIGVICFVLLV